MAKLYQYKFNIGCKVTHFARELPDVCDIHHFTAAAGCKLLQNTPLVHSLFLCTNEAAFLVLVVQLVLRKSCISPGVISRGSYRVL